MVNSIQRQQQHQDSYHTSNLTARATDRVTQSEVFGRRLKALENGRPLLCDSTHAQRNGSSDTAAATMTSNHDEDDDQIGEQADLINYERFNSLFNPIG